MGEVSNNTPEFPNKTHRGINSLEPNIRRVSTSDPDPLALFVRLHPLAADVDQGTLLPLRGMAGCVRPVCRNKFSERPHDLAHQQPLYSGGGFILNTGKYMGIALQRKRYACMPELVGYDLTRHSRRDCQSCGRVE